MVNISAHRCGVGQQVERENTREALEEAILLDCEYVEWDTQLLGDGTLVLAHDDTVSTGQQNLHLSTLDFHQFQQFSPDSLRYEEALDILASGGKKAHLDFKFRSPAYDFSRPQDTVEVRALQMSIDRLGADNVVATTTQDYSIMAMRAWALVNGLPDLLVGLSLHKDSIPVDEPDHESFLWDKLQYRLDACRANFVVSHHKFAEYILKDVAVVTGRPLLVWTVDDPQDMSKWLADDSTFLMTTNYPQQALQLRERFR